MIKMPSQLLSPEIKEIDYGIAFTVCKGNKPLYIELNKNLNKKKYKKLKKQVLAHEMLHWKSRNLLNDFKIDFLDTFHIKKQISLGKFTFENPKASLCNSPIFFDKGKIIPNYFLLSIYAGASILTLSLILILGGVI